MAWLELDAADGARSGHAVYTGAVSQRLVEEDINAERTALSELNNAVSVLEQKVCDWQFNLENIPENVDIQYVLCCCP